MKNWSEKQKNAAMQYGEIRDVPFPNVSPQADEEEVTEIAEKLVENILVLKPDCVMCQGEFTLTVKTVELLKKQGIKAVASCSERAVVETILEDGATEKKSVFEFVKFRQY
jgi:hypothetical protein